MWPHFKFTAQKDDFVYIHTHTHIYYFAEVSLILTFILWNSLNQYFTSTADSFPFSFENMAKDIVSILWSLWTRWVAYWHSAFTYIKAHWNKS